MTRSHRPLAALLCGILLLGVICFQLPASAQALWADIVSPWVSEEGGTVQITGNFDSASNQDRTLSVSYQPANGESVSGPSSVTVPAGYSSVNFSVDYGAANGPGSYIDVTISDGSSSDTQRLNYLYTD